MKTLESIITTPLVEKSRESSIPTWLMLPMAGCFICGSLFTYSPSSILNIRYESVTHLQWIAPIFMIAGGMLYIYMRFYCFQNHARNDLNSRPSYFLRDVFRTSFVSLASLDMSDNANFAQAQQISRNHCIYIHIIRHDYDDGNDFRILYCWVMVLGR